MVDKNVILLVFFFFFQAEDGIRDYKVTGVQTCALPISAPTARSRAGSFPSSARASKAGISVERPVHVGAPSTRSQIWPPTIARTRSGEPGATTRAVTGRSGSPLAASDHESPQSSLTKSPL